MEIGSGYPLAYKMFRNAQLGTGLPYGEEVPWVERMCDFTGKESCLFTFWSTCLAIVTIAIYSFDHGWRRVHRG